MNAITQSLSDDQVAIVARRSSDDPGWVFRGRWSFGDERDWDADASIGHTVRTLLRQGYADVRVLNLRDAKELCESTAATPEPAPTPATTRWPEAWVSADGRLHLGPAESYPIVPTVDGTPTALGPLGRYLDRDAVVVETGRWPGGSSKGDSAWTLWRTDGRPMVATVAR